MPEYDARQIALIQNALAIGIVTFQHDLRPMPVNTEMHGMMRLLGEMTPRNSDLVGLMNNARTIVAGKAS